MNLLEKGFMTWVAKNKNTFILVILIAGNIYQYMQNIEAQKRTFVEEQRLNSLIKEIQNSSIEYERVRGEKLEFLLNHLSTK